MRPGGLKHLVSAVNAEAVPHLRVLILKENLLTTARAEEEDYSPLTDLLSTSGLRELEEFDLSRNRLFDREIGGGGEGGEAEVVGVSAAAVAVPGRFPKLRRLDLWEHPSEMSSSQLVAFATAVAAGGAPSLQELTLPGVTIFSNPDAQGVVALVNALSGGHLSQLKSFKVDQRDDITGEAFMNICRSLATGQASLLQTLDLKMWDEENPEEGLRALAEGICTRGLTALTSFSFQGFIISGGAMSTLGLALGSGGCPCLQNLILSWEEEGDEGVGGLAEGLGGGRLSSLRDLSLEVGCGEKGGGEGSVALGEVLSTGKVGAFPSDGKSFVAQ
uniref:Uncharacterized protein n=1 Tax=Chromera velia CCMP2878 TaxID=1169474 RepID=A0A0G4HIV5_9ALVE|eukprot:Cvel_7052.t1-p1 / transcript=Cvel_7052.t1 / gene=Cvel_7052 / organism=Chromera_velia_CCMP2878 / gene_product=hypothetical protein / transcript_product=hypothetical protein / location=Cvel_scaffold360:49431-50423(-) / protein_length=331 / sequence_SO=supercontig / SO=protein_coding / is_pseudo=false